MNQKPKNFILLVEVVDRELPGNVLVGAELAGRGHNVWLIEKGRFRKSPASFPPSVVLEKGLSSGSLSRFRAIRGAGHVLAVMCQEGFIYRSGEDYIKRRVSAETIRQVDYLFLWGERQKQDLEQFLGDMRGYSVTGSPRFDLLQVRFRKSWEAQVEAIRRQHGDFVLFTSRFSSVNHFRRSLDETLDRRRAQYRDGAEETVAGRYEIQGRLFVDYMKTVGEIAVRLPGIKFVVRPHPVENAEVWRAHFADVGNVDIWDEGAAIPWLSAARCVVHNCSTTGIEAYLLDRPVREYYPGSIARSEFDPVLPGEITGVCEDAEDLAAWIERHAMRDDPGGTRNRSADELLAYYLHNYREPNAYAEIASALEGVRSPPRWAKLMNRLSRKRNEKKMKDRYIELDEVNRLLRSYVACRVGDRFVPATADEVGIRLQ